MDGAIRPGRGQPLGLIHFGLEGGKDRQCGAWPASSRNPSVPTLRRHRARLRRCNAAPRSEPSQYRQGAAVELYRSPVVQTLQCLLCIATRKPPRRKFFRVAVVPPLYGRRSQRDSVAFPASPNGRGGCGTTSRLSWRSLEDAHRVVSLDSACLRFSRPGERC